VPIPQQLGVVALSLKARTSRQRELEAAGSKTAMPKAGLTQVNLDLQATSVAELHRPQAMAILVGGPMYRLPVAGATWPCMRVPALLVG